MSEASISDRDESRGIIEEEAGKAGSRVDFQGLRRMPSRENLVRIYRSSLLKGIYLAGSITSYFNQHIGAQTN